MKTLLQETWRGALSVTAMKKVMFFVRKQLMATKRDPYKIEISWGALLSE